MRKFLIPFASAILFALATIFGYREMAQPVPFSVPTLDISVECKYSLSQRQAQRVADSEYGTFYNTDIGQVIVADHRYQGFANLPQIQVGDKATFGDADYVCSYITIGYSINGIRLEDGSQPPDADLYAITCTGYDDYQVYIIGLTRTN